MKPTTETPAARLAAELAGGVAPDQVLHTLRQALAADCVARDGSRQPDHRTRLDAMKLWLAYSVGLPVQRSETLSISLDADHGSEAMERISRSPAARKALRAMLDKADAADGAIDV